MLLIQALLIGALAVVGLIAALISPTGEAEVLGFAVNIPHGLLLLATAVGSVLATVWPRLAAAWAFTQATVYTLVFSLTIPTGAGLPRDTVLNLNTADYFLHIGLAGVGLVLGMLLLVWPAAPLLGEDNAEVQHG